MFTLSSFSGLRNPYLSWNWSRVRAMATSTSCRGRTTLPGICPTLLYSVRFRTSISSTVFRFRRVIKGFKRNKTGFKGDLQFGIELKNSIYVFYEVNIKLTRHFILVKGRRDWRLQKFVSKVTSYIRFMIYFIVKLNYWNVIVMCYYAFNVMF